jgi:anti-sigma factor RsiW
MTQDELAELLDLYIDDALPEGLRAKVEAHLAAHPDAAHDAASLQATVLRLQSAPHERPDTWFVERALDRLLQEHSAAQETNTGESEPRKAARLSSIL